MRQSGFSTSVVLIVVSASLEAYDINETISINGVIAGAVQCENVSNASGTDNECRGALPIQPELSIRPTASDEFLFKLGFAAGNGLNVFLPSYDAGAALEWQAGHWAVHGVYLNIGENDDGNNYNVVGAQLRFRADTAFGEGNYRVIIDTTSNAFLDPTGT